MPHIKSCKFLSPHSGHQSFSMRHTSLPRSKKKKKGPRTTMVFLQNFLDQHFLSESHRIQKEHRYAFPPQANLQHWPLLEITFMVQPTKQQLVLSYFSTHRCECQNRRIPEKDHVQSPVDHRRWLKFSISLPKTISVTLIPAAASSRIASQIC